MGNVLSRIVQGVYFDISTVESNPIYSTFLNLQMGDQTDTLEISYGTLKNTEF